MTTVYTKAKNYKLTKWTSTAAAIVGVVCCLLYIILEICVSPGSYQIFYYCWIVFYFYFLFSQFQLRRYVLDEESGTLSSNDDGGFPIRIQMIKTIKYKTHKNGKFHKLFIHEIEVRFMEVRLNKESADQLVAQLLKLNPSIEVENHTTA